MASCQSRVVALRGIDLYRKRIARNNPATDGKDASL
jgi:hypothetical protein